MKALFERARLWMRAPRAFGYQLRVCTDVTTWGFALGFGNAYTLRVLLLCFYFQVYPAR